MTNEELKTEIQAVLDMPNKTQRDELILQVILSAADAKRQLQAQLMTIKTAIDNGMTLDSIEFVED